MANKLAQEQSLYLLHHAHNPVDWYPWGDEPFDIAKQQNKPVIVSIGYAACHWCHVMERESFEDENVAAFMNKHFINIKVDREEHPDVDHFYMDAVQAITQSGGWPLNVFVTPNRTPFYGGTYFPPKQSFNRISWLDLLQRMYEVWTNKPDEVQAQATQMLQYLKRSSSGISANTTSVIGNDAQTIIAQNILAQADKVNGGFGNAPKFPSTMAINFLLQHAHQTQSATSYQQAIHSLNAMRKGGIYDQIGGGFSRYATDDKWLVPHFEKMLYDNALFLIVYSEAYLLKPDEHYKQVIEDTIAFCNRELKHPSGIFYSALDADSEGIEGKYYTWTWKEWQETVGSEAVISEAYFGVEEAGNWEEVNILHNATDVEEIATKHKKSKDEVKDIIQTTSRKLFEKRQLRKRPLTDDKCLLSWNALMNLALIKTAIALGNATYLNQAKTQMDALLLAFEKDNQLMHVWKNDEARIAAHLDDYAYLIQALIQLGAIVEDEQYFLKAKAMTEIVIQEFSHEVSQMFYFTAASQKSIPLRKVDVYDGATPSPNAMMAHNLFLLGLCFENNMYTTRAEAMLQSIIDVTTQYPVSFGYWAMLAQGYLQGFKTVVVHGAHQNNIASQLRQANHLHCLILTSRKEISDIPILSVKNISDETAIFVCTMQACLAPIHSVKAALSVMVNR